MANDDMSFSYNGYSNAITDFSIKNGHFSMVMRGKKSGPRAAFRMTGVGIFEGIPTSEDQRNLEELRHVICTMQMPSTMSSGNPFFGATVECRDGKQVSAYIDLVHANPVENGKILQLTHLLTESFYKNGRKTAKLDVEAAIAPKDGKLLITLKFINSGMIGVAFKSPATWEGTYNPINGNSWAEVGGGTNESGFSIPLLGHDQFSNAADYPGDVISIPPGQYRLVKFLSYPEDKIKNGTYDSGGASFIKEFLDPPKLRGIVEFEFSDTKVEFQQDYPSSQKEQSEFESYRRQQISHLSYPVGTPVPEAGYYRAYGENGERDSLPKRFAAGDIFPTRTIEKLIRGGRQDLGHAAAWQWEAFADAQITGHSLGRCPRAGLWLPSVPVGVTNESYFRSVVSPIRLEEGATIPRLGLANPAHEAWVVWTWIGQA